MKKEIIEAALKKGGFASAERVMRVEVGGNRNYFRMSNQRVYRSLTTFLSHVMPPSRHLKNWRESMIEDLGSIEKTDAFVSATADYGSFVHIELAGFANEQTVVWDAFEKRAHKALAEMGIQGETAFRAADELKMDFACFAQWIHDYNVVPLAIEAPVFHQKGIATFVDFVCEMDAKKYVATPPAKRVRETVLVNFKTGKKGFFDSHAMQVAAELEMCNQTFPTVKIDFVANLAPTDWRTEPSYKFKKYDPIEILGLQQDLNNYLAITERNGFLSVPKLTTLGFFGETKFGESPLGAIGKLDYLTEILK